MLLIYFRTIRMYFLWGLIFLVFTPIGLLLTLVPEKRRFDNRVYFYFTMLWSKLLLIATCVCVKIEGKENLPIYPDSPALIIVNHTSTLDIPLIDWLVGSYPHIWMSKASYGKLPLFGTLLRRMHVLVNRDNPRQAGRALLKVYNRAKEGNRHIILFPEGTRSKNGKLQPFLGGFAVLAKKLNRSVIPITIKGAFEVMPSNSFLVNPRACDVIITIGEPILPKNNDHVDIFTQNVYNQFSQSNFL